MTEKRHKKGYSVPYKSGYVYNELRLKGMFCDAIIMVEDVEFQVHKIFLCGCSNYFRALFENWSIPDQRVYNIPGVPPYTMQLIIQFAYTNYVSVTEDNVQDLLLAADQLNVMEIVQTCCRFLEEQLCPENCVGIWQFTSFCYSSELRRKAHKYIIGHFEELVSCDEFLQLSAQDLCDEIKRDDLIVKKESTVFEAVLRWIGHAPHEREDCIVMLLSNVRLALMSDEYLRINVSCNNLVKNSAECLDMVLEAAQTISHILVRNHRSRFCSLRARPRLPSTILFAIGGWSNGDPTNTSEVYDIRTNQWFKMTKNLVHPRAYHGVVSLNGFIYCVGGYDRVEYFNGVSRFDLRTQTWHEVAPMYWRRCYISVTVLNGCVYAMGGFDGHTRLNKAEYYTPETNQWRVIADMHEHRSDANCTTLHNKIYISGGFNGTECLQTAECYSPEANQWTVIAPMNSTRSGIGLIAYADHIYAAGGYDGLNRLQTVEAYNPLSNSWQEKPPMSKPRSNFGIEVVEGRLFVVGGFNGLNTTPDVECYDATSDEWVEACDMDNFRSGLSCCVVSGLPNMADYTVLHDYDDLPPLGE